MVYQPVEECYKLYSGLTEASALLHQAHQGSGEELCQEGAGLSLSGVELLPQGAGPLLGAHINLLSFPHLEGNVSRL